MSRRRARKRPSIERNPTKRGTPTPTDVPIAGPFKVDRVIEDEAGVGVEFSMPEEQARSLGLVPEGPYSLDGGVPVDPATMPPLIEPILSRRHEVWLDRFVAKDETRAIRRALKQQGWTITEAPGRTNQHDRAYPPGVDPETDGWPYVVLPSTIGEGRAAANLVAALRRAGPFVWKGR